MTDTFAVGDIVTGKVAKITNFGAFVEFENGQSGMVHISEIDHSFVKDVREFLTEEQQVEVKVIGIKDDGKITLSIKQAAEPKFERKPVRRQHNPEFEKMLKSYMKSSEQRLSDIKRNKMAKQ
jgi:S1 RNA binding domain protein